MSAPEKPVDAQADPKELARNLLKEGATIDDAATQSGLNRNIVLGLYSALVRADKRLKVANERTEAGTEQEIDFQAQNQADQFEGATGGLASSPPVPSSLQNVPSGYVLKPALTPSEWKELAALDKGKLVAMVADLKASNSSLQAQAVMPKSNGDERFSNYDQELKRLEVERQRIQNDQDREYAMSIREDRMRSRTGKGDSLGWKEVIDIVKLVGGRQEGGFGIADFLKMQTETQRQNWDFAQRQLDLMKELKPEVMGDGVRIQLAQMQMNMEEKKMEAEREFQKWGALGKIAAPFAPTISQIAGGLLGQKGPQPGDNPSSTRLQCSTCGHTWEVSTKQRGSIFCPECKNPIPMEIFAEPETPTFTCPKCGLQMTVPPGTPEQVTLKCPKCGTITETKQQTPATSESPQAPLPPSPAEEKPSSVRLKPKYW